MGTLLSHFLHVCYHKFPYYHRFYNIIYLINTGNVYLYMHELHKDTYVFMYVSFIEVGKLNADKNNQRHVCLHINVYLYYAFERSYVYQI